MKRTVTEAEIRQVYRETIDGLYGYVSRRCRGDRALAEDVTQETWLRAVRAWRSGGLPDRPLAWLSTVARNLLLNHFRRTAPLSLDEWSGIDEFAAESDGSGETADTEVVQRALERLPAQQSRLLRAFHFERQKVAQIATTSGLSERAVEGRLRRARQSLRRLIEAALKIEGGTT